MFIRLSTAFVMLLGLTAVASAGVPLPRSDVDKRDNFVRSEKRQPNVRGPVARRQSPIPAPNLPTINWCTYALLNPEGLRKQAPKRSQGSYH
ncbi:hypothetical protein BDR04DRAFT_1147342 [Suillus decipiens]|nr:hypothetical protein BDR04DRAFT_1147342 [Suillus decipiens]